MSSFARNFAHGLIVSATLLFLLEILARILLPARSPEAVAFRLENPEVYERVGGKYTTKSSNFFFPLSTESQKKKGLLRILVLGGSNVYAMEDLPVLRRTLAEKLHKPVEILNMSGGGFGNLRLLAALPDAMGKLDPDLILVYSGNNEWEEAYLIDRAEGGTVLRRMLVILEYSRLFQALERGIGRAGALLMGAAMDSWRNGSPFLLAQSLHVEPGSKISKDKVYRYYESSLRKMADLAHEKKLPIVFTSIAYNRAHPPFFPADRSYEAALMELKEKNYPAALEHFEKAVESDGNPHRADRTINALIAKTARSAGAYYLDFDNFLASRSLQGVLGTEFFADHCHFTRDGNRLLQEAWADFILSKRLLR